MSPDKLHEIKKKKKSTSKLGFMQRNESWFKVPRVGNKTPEKPYTTQTPKPNTLRKGKKKYNTPQTLQTPLELTLLLLSRFNRVGLCTTRNTATHEAFSSLGIPQARTLEGIQLTTKLNLILRVY